MTFNPVKRNFSKNQIKILKLLLDKDYLQNELQHALNTTASNLHYHLSRLEDYELVRKETIQEIGSAKINKISLNPSAHEYVRKILGYKNKKTLRNNGSAPIESSYKTTHGKLKKFKNNYYPLSIVIFLLCLIGIIVTGMFLFIPEINNPETSELTADADIFTQVSQIDNINLTADADIFTQVSQIDKINLTADADIYTQKTNSSDINVYDGSGATPFLRLGLYEFTYDSGGYLSEIYVRFNLPKIENITSMLLQLTYWSGYPVEADDYYDVNASLVSNTWAEEDTTWTETPEYLNTSTLVYLHNPGLESQVYLNITNLVEGLTETMITIRLCPNNLSRIRYPAPFESSESYGVTPKLILKYEEPFESSINVYDGSGATPFLRLGLYEFTYDSGGYLSEIYVRYNLSKIEEISSMILRLTYYDGYPIEADYNYIINASLMNNNWVEEDTVWTERPEYLGTSALIYLHNPSLQSEINLDITNLVEGLTETMITIRLCPHNLSIIRFPAPFKSSESYGITPQLLVDYSTSSPFIRLDETDLGLIGLLILFGILCILALTGIIYGRQKQKIREFPAVIKQNNIVPIIEQNKLTHTLTEGYTESPVPKEEIRKTKIVCPYCGFSNFESVLFCTACGKRIIPELDSVDISKFLGGLIASLIGGLASILIGFSIPFVYPEIEYYMEDFIIILQTIIIIGGIVNIIGSLVVFFKPKLGVIIIFIGGIVAGINIITLFGASSISKKLRN